MGNEHDDSREIPVDVTDHGDSFEISADLPGYVKQDLDVQVMTDRVQITADVGTTEGYGVQRSGERRRHRRSRVVTLTESVDHRGASARYQDGVLWLRLKKR